MFDPRKFAFLERETAEERSNDGAVVRAAATQRIGPLVHKAAHLGLAVSEPFLHQKRLG